ncbi:tight adherence protein B [Paenibacillus shirakamiensis]|uniref:Tight adherence protein B n=1 Tax=Paenibacillus shirakamiensis TaxID=1265935 RepID=A0ABS4JFS8_9BACL|nr:type II secretion system F family protein [Paenibacillus shirakamiensis]MBP2000558.1 tight adherence protein B [Paenibacillus shirakamiensis]
MKFQPASRLRSRVSLLAQSNPFKDSNSMKKGLQQGVVLPMYNVFDLTLKQKVFCTVIGGILCYGIGYIFFHLWFIAAVLSLGGGYAPQFWSRYRLARRRSALSMHFKQALGSLSSSLAAGRSVENGFREAINDLRLLYPDAQNDLIVELSIICTRLEYGQPIEEALQDFSHRADMEDITNFADVFTTCKRTGGDLVEIVRRTAGMISEKLEIRQEISVMMAQKRFEAKALLGTPVFFLIFMDLSSPEYMLPLYSGTGLFISGTALLLFLACFWMTNKIMNIEV